MEDFRGNQIEEATFSSPVNIVGWNELSLAGERWTALKNKKEAEKYVADTTAGRGVDSEYIGDPDGAHAIIPVVLKADATSGLEGLRHETEKYLNEKIAIKIIRSAIGDVTENDVLFANTTDNAMIAGFNVVVDEAARTVADREGLDVSTFSVIYDAAEWIANAVEKHTPMLETEVTTGEAKILKHFSQTKSKQVIGGKVQSGELKLDESVIIKRRDTEINRGRITNLQHQKSDVSKVEEGMEFGAEIESKREIQDGDTIEAFEVVVK